LKTVWLLLLAALLAIPLLCQPQQESKPSFEVSSVKPSSPTQQGGMELQPNGRFVAYAVTVRNLLTTAYRVRNFQIVGGPGWIETDRFDVEARAEEGSIRPSSGFPDPNVPGPMETRIQSLLEDRFQLKAHRETRELPVYELTAAKGGSKMKLSDDQTVVQRKPGDPPPPLPRGGGLPRGALRAGRGNMEANAIPFANFVSALSGMIGRTIVDKTGLTGFYDIKLQWSPDSAPAANAAAPAAPETQPVDSNGPSIFTALQEQLGLKLESAKGPVAVIVIDSIEKPSQN
jgi:uncharacterized protein (TIGR03435 family)